MSHDREQIRATEWEHVQQSLRELREANDHLEAFVTRQFERFQSILSGSIDLSTSQPSAIAIETSDLSRELRRIRRTLRKQSRQLEELKKSSVPDRANCTSRPKRRSSINVQDPSFDVVLDEVEEIRQALLRARVIEDATLSPDISP